VQVVTPFTRHFPFLLESDTLSLSSAFELRESMLYDMPLRAIHHLRHPGEEIIIALSEGLTMATLRNTAKYHAITDPQFNELVGFLNIIGALRCERTWQQKLLVLRTRLVHLLLGTRYQPLSWRRSATLGLTFAGILRATWMVGLASLVVSIMAATAGLASWGTVIGLNTFGNLLFVASMFGHEVAHILISRYYSAEPQLLQAGLRFGILHRKLPSNAEAQSALAGPFIGSLLCMAASCIALAVHANVYALLGGIIALFHSLSLLPWYGDGASFHKALHERRKQ
jgi:hypothetical protein